MYSGGELKLLLTHACRNLYGCYFLTNKIVTAHIICNHLVPSGCLLNVWAVRQYSAYGEMKVGEAIRVSRECAVIKLDRKHNFYSHYCLQWLSLVTFSVISLKTCEFDYAKKLSGWWSQDFCTHTVYRDDLCLVRKGLSQYTNLSSSFFRAPKICGLDCKWKRFLI
jgi:hypothetical protein